MYMRGMSAGGFCAPWGISRGLRAVLASLSPMNIGLCFRSSDASIADQQLITANPDAGTPLATSPTEERIPRTMRS